MRKVVGAEVSEQMDVIAGQVRVLQHNLIKYACPCCDQSLKVARAPARIIPRGLLTERAQAWVVTGKYSSACGCTAEVHCCVASVATLRVTRWGPSSYASARPCSRSSNLLRAQSLDSELIYCNETTVQMLKEPGGKAQPKSFMWAQMNGTGQTVRLFAYAPGGDAVYAEKLSAGISTHITDGYDVYNGIAKAAVSRTLGAWFTRADRSSRPRRLSRRQLAHRIRSRSGSYG